MRSSQWEMFPMAAFLRSLKKKEPQWGYCYSGKIYTKNHLLTQKCKGKMLKRALLIQLDDLLYRARGHNLALL